MATHDLIDRATNGAVSGDVVRSALEHQELLVPALLGVAGAVAAVKGPSIVRGLSGSGVEKVESTAKNVGANAVEGAKANVERGLGGDGGNGGGGKKTRRLPIQRWTDVTVPVDQAYEAWTKFDQFPKFMHRVLSVEQKGDDALSWEEKIWFSKRQWEGCITERRKNDRIVWKTTSGMSHKGIISFHRLDERLTRVMVEMEFEPSGMIEKLGSGLRFVKRAVQSDLARFKAYVEMEDAEGIEYRSNDRQQEADQQDDGNERAARRTDRAARRSKTTTPSSSSPSSNAGQQRSPAKRGSAKRTRTR